MSYIRKIKRGNKVYLAEVEGKRINGKVVQHHICYVGKQADGMAILSTSMSDVHRLNDIIMSKNENHKPKPHQATQSIL